MKRIILGLLLVFMVSSNLAAQETTTTTRIRYWYYPSQNVYYNDVTGTYWYYDVPSVKWMEAKELPSGYKMPNKSTRYTIYYRVPEVWKDNKTHKIKYKIKKDGTIKRKVKS